MDSLASQAKLIEDKRYLDIPSLISWLSAKQYAPEGGFAGRTNKLVDGCYSHWVGGCWPLVDAALTGPQSQADLETPTRKEALFSQKGLARYILCCCQSEDGGLRDKPSTCVICFLPIVLVTDMNSPKTCGCISFVLYPGRTQFHTT